MEDGRSGAPRPPRRVPAGAGTLTQLEAPTRSSGAQPPPRGPWIFGRILAGLLVLIVIVAGGAGAGWYVRAQSLRIDTAAVLTSAGPAVVRVLATTCAGTGEASGVVIDNGRVLTAASAVDQPKSIIVVAQDGRIRRANLLATSADGVAVLQSIGLNESPLRLPAADPERKAERALVGYTAAGKQVVNAVGSEADPEPLSQFMNAAKLGGPVVGKSGELVGLVTGDTVQASTIVPLSKLRGYVAQAPSGVTVGTLGDCPESRGPQSPIAPVLQVANTPLAREAQRVLTNYLTLQNQHEFGKVRAYYSPRFAGALTEAQDRDKHLTSYFFNPRLTDLAPDGSSARMAYNVLFAPTATGADGQNCTRLDTTFYLVRSRGQLVIDRTVKASEPAACDA
ncbi:trypsin-like peptidase domain-containing protein [Kribbella speibonae]|uniref:Serine protease n=1 Tax=Kribbella speibonae TaxID=1572660 RepID=A0A4V2M423_9ACTN|nr:trypsin-like peptidase domain-containing protein [Kribbella speibonae]TCC34252.1 serine protease [Kribbella speibonae]